MNKSIESSSELNFWNRIAIALLMVFNFALNFNTIDNNDTWWHLKMGEWMVKNHQLYTTEIFSRVTEGKTYIAYEWLSQILFYFMLDTNGVWLSIFKLVLMGVGFASFVWLIARPYWKGALTFPILISLVYLLAFRAQVRPHLLGEWCTAFLVVGFVSWQKHSQIRKLWWLIPLQIFWANLHGSFLLGPVLTLFWGGCLFVSQKIKFFPGDSKTSVPSRAPLELIGLSLVLALVSLINPNGFDLLRKSFVMFFSHNYLREYIKEWYSVAEFVGAYWLYFWAAWIAGCWVLLIKNWREIQLVEVATLALATAFPFTGVRAITLSTLISFPIILKYTHLSFPTGYRPKLMALILLPCIYIAACIGYPQGPGDHREVGIGFSYKMVPLDIIQHIKSHKMSGVMMNDYDEGAFVIYYLYPQVKTVMDSRTELYEQALFEEHREANFSYPAYLRYVEKYQATLLMVRISNQVLRNELFKDPNWKLEKVGVSFDLFSRVTPLNPKEVNQDIDLKNSIAANTGYVEPKQQYCAFVRLYGHCLQAPECERECAWTDTEVAQNLGMNNSMCLVFSQACYKKETACGNCRTLCDHYRVAIPKLNKALGTRYPEAPLCQ